MGSKLWGLSLSPGEKHALLHPGTLKLNHATLPLVKLAPGRSQLKVLSNGEEYVLCTLSHDAVQEQKLDLSFTEDMIDCVLLVTGTNAISLTGFLHDEDEDFQLDEEDEEEDGSGMLQFRDPSDNRFLGGFELRHFGLGSPPLTPVYDNIDLRKEEITPEDKSLHDNIVQGLINSMMNSGDRYQLKTAKRIAKNWKLGHKNGAKRK
ncbi:hypothetical protein BCR42DRAFT_413376 [Absidia repens]|uniref:Nucleoplasmin-like domain-containing protein n=1 Tax=Absidia repens TaxID=90262 RepID=A0A1X2IHM0_9FUNG|nr:hypothetical protein BCR42DRAFT_413376 [Absidia repens]